MARVLDSERMIPADELRDLLAESERQAANLRTAPSGARELLDNLDQIARLWPDLEARGVDLRAEAGRWETVQAMVRANAHHLLRALRPEGGLPALRKRNHADDEAAWWWYLAEETRRTNLQRARRLAVIGGSVVVAAVLVIWVLNRLFPVPPEVRAAMNKQIDGQQKIENGGDYAGAIADFQEVVTLTPDDASGWLWLGCTQYKLEDQSAAEESFRQARALLEDELTFRLSRAPDCAMLDLLDLAKGDLEAALAIDPDNPQAL